MIAPLTNTVGRSVADGSPRRRFTSPAAGAGGYCINHGDQDEDFSHGCFGGSKDRVETSAPPEPQEPASRAHHLQLVRGAYEQRGEVLGCDLAQPDGAEISTACTGRGKARREATGRASQAARQDPGHGDHFPAGSPPDGAVRRLRLPVSGRQVTHLRIVLAALLGLILGVALFDALMLVWLGLAVDALLRAAGGGW